MERYLSVEVRHEIPRTELRSTFARFSPDCPDLLPIVITIRQIAGAPPNQDALTWLRRRVVPCWYVQDDALGHAFAPKDALFCEELGEEFYQWITVIGPPDRF